MAEARKEQASSRHRISGYCGFIPGLAFNAQVNSTEYADWELDARNGARFDPAYDANATNVSGGRNAPVDSLPERVAAGWARTPSETTLYHPRQSQKSFAPRSKIMGYNGYVPGMRHTHGVINSDYQNEEFFLRKHHLLTPTESPESARIQRVSSPKDSKQRVRTPPRGVTPPKAQEKTLPRRSQSANSQRPFILPPHLMGQIPPSTPDASNTWLLRNDDRVVYTVQDYTTIPRLCSYAGYRPGKKFVAG